ARRKGWIEEVDVEREEDGTIADALAHRVRVALRAENAQPLTRGDHESERPRIPEVGRAVQRTAHPGLQRRVRVKDALFDGAFERRAVEVALAEVLVPGVGVRVEQNE